MPSETASKNNGKLGGRPKLDTSDKIKFSNAKNVILTQKQYDKLSSKYDTKLLETALTTLDKWLSDGSEKSKEYVKKNHYAYFRSDGWLINAAIRQVSVDEKIKFR